MKILVMGAGAMGSAVGGFMARAGHGVTLVGRKAHMEAVSHEPVPRRSRSGARDVQPQASDFLKEHDRHEKAQSRFRTVQS